MASKAHITPKVFKWARESARMSLETAARKVSVPVEKLELWEKGELQPTIRQAQTLAKAYKRPFALFFLPEIPRDFQPLQDFRKADSVKLSTSSIFIIREIQQKQAWISEVNEENDESKLDFVGRFSINDSAEIVAQDILNTLEIPEVSFNSERLINTWIEAAESKGIFISRTSFIHSRLKLDSKELQGFAISDPYAPFVFINSEDWNAPQLFTLVHELAHIWIAESGISNVVEPQIEDIDKRNPIELFCNEVAANGLMPRNSMLSLPETTFQNSTEVYKTAKGFGVSTFSFLVRALNLNLISVSKYHDLKKAADLVFNEFLKKQADRKEKQKNNEGGPNYFLLQLNRNGRLFTQAVLDSFKGGRIEPTVASSLLNIQVNKFNKLESQLYK